MFGEWVWFARQRCGSQAASTLRCSYTGEWAARSAFAAGLARDRLGETSKLQVAPLLGICANMRRASVAESPPNWSKGSNPIIYQTRFPRMSQFTGPLAAIGQTNPENDIKQQVYGNRQLNVGCQQEAPKLRRMPSGIATSNESIVITDQGKGQALLDNLQWK
eukprot:EST44336.1 Hypothetical protein SS50377_15876 [Spironucleus salmonicida]